MHPSHAPDVFAATLLAQHGAALHAYFRRATGHGDLARDLAHDTLVRVLQALPGYEHRGRDRAWLFAIAHNVLVEHVRAVRRRGVAEGAYDVLQPPRQDVRAAIDQALSRLPDEDRHVLLLAELAGLSYREIAAIRGLTAAAVRSRLFRARLTLRAVLAPPARRGPSTIHRNDHDDCDREVLSALLDREDVDPDVLAHVLDQHENRALLIDFVRVRAALHVDEPMEEAMEPGGHEVPPFRRRLPRGLVRAAAVLVLVGASLAGGAWYARHALADTVPEPSRIIQLTPVEAR